MKISSVPKYKLCNCIKKPKNVNKINIYTIRLFAVEVVVIIFLYAFYDQILHNVIIKNPVKYMINDCKIDDLPRLKRNAGMALSIRYRNSYVHHEDTKEEITELDPSIKHRKDLHAKCAVAYTNTRFKELDDILFIWLYLLIFVAIIHIPTAICCFRKSTPRAMFDLICIFMCLLFPYLILEKTIDQKNAFNDILKSPEYFLNKNQMYEYAINI